MRLKTAPPDAEPSELITTLLLSESEEGDSGSSLLHEDIVTDSATRIRQIKSLTLNMMFHIASVFLSLAFDWFTMEKRRNLYLLPSYHLRLLALPYLSRTATQKPTLVYAINTSGNISREISCRKLDNYITTGIYRCSILDLDRNFARISDGQESARINAFLKCLFPSRSPVKGLLREIHNCKISALNLIMKDIAC